MLRSVSLGIAAIAGVLAPGLARGQEADAPAAPRDAMAGALGHYPMTREASGTAWQPDSSEHAGIHINRDDWTVMVHGLFNGVYDWQQGPRGDEDAFVSGMLMVMAKRPVAEADTLQFKVMLSPDPPMGKRGYPLLLASGETADGVTPLVDRQHPHDLFMELSGSYSHRLEEKDSVFFYAGLPGEPAFGPPAFMHRASIMDSPEAPISHHWLDSTHVTFGVVTAGFIHDGWKLEASQFHGREPDMNRYDIETGALDSSSARVSWNPSDSLSLQASWAHVKSPEQLDPAENQTKWSASAIYTNLFGDKGGWWSTTLAWGRRTSSSGDLDALALEATLRPSDPWTVFGRLERVDNNELTLVAGHAGPVYGVGKASVGVIHDWRAADHAKLGLGGLLSTNRLPAGLAPSYGGSPGGGMLFVRLKID